jgi:hypothetical protein
MEQSPESTQSTTEPLEVSAGEPETNDKKWLVTAIIIAIVVLAGIIIGVVTLSGMDANGTGKVRDIFLIFTAVEFLVIGVALVVLIIQLASLINLLNNEVRPILKSTSETVNTLKGTTQFLSENMVEPVIKLNEYLAGLKKLMDVINIFK